MEFVAETESSDGVEQASSGDELPEESTQPSSPFWVDTSPVQDQDFDVTIDLEDEESRATPTAPERPDGRSSPNGERADAAARKQTSRDTPPVPTPRESVVPAITAERLLVEALPFNRVECQVGRFPWLTPAEELIKRANSLKPWQQVYKARHTNFLHGGCKVPLYNTQGLVDEHSPLTSDCYLQYFLQWRFFKDPKSKKLFKAKKSVLCQQWNVFCSSPHSWIDEIPALFSQYRETSHHKKEQLHFRSLDGRMIPCACVRFCPCCTPESRRLDHAFRTHSDYFLLPSKLRRLVAEDIDPSCTAAQVRDEEMATLIKTLNENAAEMRSVLSGLKRKIEHLQPS
jgi:hypothetical protein